jgi:hypothetical protein
MQEIQFLDFNFILFFLNLILDILFYKLAGLFLDRPSRLNHVEETLIQFNIKLRLNKDLGWIVFFPVNLVFFFSISFSCFFYWYVKLPLDRPSRLGYAETTTTWFNLKLGLSNKSGLEVSRLSQWSEFNKNKK